jgi:hypothetical protein
MRRALCRAISVHLPELIQLQLPGHTAHVCTGMRVLACVLAHHPLVLTLRSQAQLCRDIQHLTQTGASSPNPAKQLGDSTPPPLARFQNWARPHAAL